jgi:hypothetical protein
MSIVEQDGIYSVQWSTRNVALTSYPVRLRVEDGRGGSDTQDFAIQVVSQQGNLPPTITSDPPAFNATLGREYQYNLTATDPDNDPIEWKLVSGPRGMTVNPLTGALDWTPTQDQLGPQNVVVQVYDPYGGSSSESFTLTARAANLAPYFTSIPHTGATRPVHRSCGRSRRER